MEFLNGRRCCWATLIVVTRRDGTPYPDDNWRVQFIGKRGWFEFLNHAFAWDAYHTVRFSECENKDECEWVMETGEMMGIRETADMVEIITNSSRYVWELEIISEEKDFINYDPFRKEEN